MLLLGSFLDQLALDEPVTDDLIGIIAKACGSHWVRVGAHLPKYTEKEVRDIVSSLRQESGDVRDSDRLRHVLMKWRARDGPRATLRMVLDACEKVEIRGEAELALKDSFEMDWEN